MKKRRYHITKEQSRVILIALKTYIDEISNLIQNVKDKTEQGFLRYSKNQAEQIKQELENYKWEVE